MGWLRNASLPSQASERAMLVYSPSSMITVGPFRSQAVRQAIAWCFDRDLTAAEYTGNFGQSVDGYFGLGQWMYGVIAGTVQVPATATAYDSMNLSGLTHYTVDTARAASLLDSDGWQLNDAGIRAKDIGISSPWRPARVYSSKPAIR